MIRKKTILELGKKIAFRSKLFNRFSKPHYPFNLEPVQLARIIEEIEQRRDTPGCVVEIGVARGMTTRFIAEHLLRSGSKKTLYCVDTFSSFTQKDIDYEVHQRSKDLSLLRGFEYNDFEVWKNNFREFDGQVVPIQSDCSVFDYSGVAPISVALLDVDLYLPTTRTLPHLYEALEPGGVIFVDDVMADHHYDGAAEAYFEFVRANGLPERVLGNKCGLIYKP